MFFSNLLAWNRLTSKGSKQKSKAKHDLRYGPRITSQFPSFNLPYFPVQITLELIIAVLPSSSMIFIVHGYSSSLPRLTYLLRSEGMVISLRSRVVHVDSNTPPASLVAYKFNAWKKRKKEENEKFSFNILTQRAQFKKKERKKERIQMYFT